MNFYYFCIGLENLDNLMACNWGHLKVYEMILQNFRVKRESKICCKFTLHLSLKKSTKQLIEDPKLGEEKEVCCCTFMTIDLFFKCLVLSLEGSWCR